MACQGDSRGTASALGEDAMRGDLLGTMLGGTRHRLRRLGERPSAMAVTLALALPVLIGIVGLGIEASDWVLEKRKLQEAVATASPAGALAQADHTESISAETIESAPAEVALTEY